MDTTPGPADAPSTFHSALRRALGARARPSRSPSSAPADLGAGQAHAAGISGGLTPVRAAGTPAPHPHRNHAAHPANLPAATTTAYRYSCRDGQLIRL